jgi:hypothetical protein
LSLFLPIHGQFWKNAISTVLHALGSICSY